MPRLVFLVLVAACSHASNPAIDGGHADGRADASRPDAARLDAPPAPSDALLPYRHTVTIDGVDDFAVAEQLATTSAAYGARVTWDADNIYVGYVGPDLDPSALDTASKWLFVYLDVDPGQGTGAAASQAYNTQHAVFPSGFGAEYYARWKCDTTVASIEQHAGGAWTTLGATPAVAQAGSFVELAIPRSVLGATTTIGLVSWMINEKDQFEGSFAGLYATNFVDGYAAALPLTAYLRADLTAALAPSDPANRAP